MKTFVIDIIPKIKQYSERLDNITLLTSKHWVLLEELDRSKSVYIFRSNKELLISINGRVTKAKWEYIGNEAILIDIGNESYLLKHGFFDENILALKIDGLNEYALLVNESKFDQTLNTLEKISEVLNLQYLNSDSLIESNGKRFQILLVKSGVLKIYTDRKNSFSIGNEVELNGIPAPDGKYKTNHSFFSKYILVENGRIKYF